MSYWQSKMMVPHLSKIQEKIGVEGLPAIEDQILYLMEYSGIAGLECGWDEGRAATLLDLQMDEDDIEFQSTNPHRPHSTGI